MFKSCDQLQQATLHRILPAGAPNWGPVCTLSRPHVNLCSHTRSPFRKYKSSACRPLLRSWPAQVVRGTLLASEEARRVLSRRT